MTQQYEGVQGMDFTLPSAPPLTDSQVSLLSESRLLIDIEGMVQRRQQLVDKMASAEMQLADMDVGPDADLDGGDTPGEPDSEEDAAKALRQQMSEWDNELGTLDTALKELQQWEHGFVYLPELDDGSVTVYANDSFPATSTSGKQDGLNQPLFLRYDPFVIVALDERSSFGWPLANMTDRLRRATRGLRAYEPPEAGLEFWTGAQVPTNWHLSASPSSPLTSPHVTLRYAYDNPTAPPGTTLGVSESLSDSLAILDQAIADARCGTGMIHCTPYVAQKWMQVYPYVRDSNGDIRSVNSNIIVPDYGYPGTGPDQASRTVADGVTDSTTALTSATADFTNFDIGNPVEGDGIPEGTVIAAIVSDTEATMSNAATASASDVTITLPGVGGNAAGLELQWAYATDFVYRLRGDVMLYPADLRQVSPDITEQNLVPARAERNHALITNQLLRAAVLVDTTTP